MSFGRFHKRVSRRFSLQGKNPDGQDLMMSESERTLSVDSTENDGERSSFTTDGPQDVDSYLSPHDNQTDIDAYVEKHGVWPDGPIDLDSYNLAEIDDPSDNDSCVVTNDGGIDDADKSCSTPDSPIPIGIDSRADTNDDFIDEGGKSCSSTPDSPIPINAIDSDGNDSPPSESIACPLDQDDFESIVYLHDQSGKPYHRGPQCCARPNTPAWKRDSSGASQRCTRFIDDSLGLPTAVTELKFRLRTPRADVALLFYTRAEIKGFMSEWETSGNMFQFATKKLVNGKKKKVGLF